MDSSKLNSRAENENDGNVSSGSRSSSKARSQLDLIKQYMIGRFDNSDQIEAQKRSGRQISPFALHVNTPLEPLIDNLPDDFNTNTSFHVLEETYLWQPGSRNALLTPVLLRFDTVADGAIALNSLQIPPDLELASVRHDNPMLRFVYTELVQSKTFPISPVYDYDEVTQEFNLDVSVDLPEDRKFQLTETLSPNRLTVHTRLWKDGNLVLGSKDTPLYYDRK